MSTPSVKKRTLVLADRASSNRTLYPTSPPTLHPISSATLLASAIAGSRLGCVIAIDGPRLNRVKGLSPDSGVVVRGE